MLAETGVAQWTERQGALSRVTNGTSLWNAHHGTRLLNRMWEELP